MVKAQALKFIYTFCEHIPPPQLPEYATFVTAYLTADSNVVRSYAAATIEKILLKKNKETNTQLFTSETTNMDFINGLLSKLCLLLKEE